MPKKPLLEGADREEAQSILAAVEAMDKRLACKGTFSARKLAVLIRRARALATKYPDHPGSAEFIAEIAGIGRRFTTPSKE